MIVVIVQCRINSTRLPKKALLNLMDAPVIAWTLRAMKKVKADFYYLATDTNSYEYLEPIAKKFDWSIYAGSEENVLQRFCDVIKITNADTVLRATGDNPFLFYEAAIDSLEAFKKFNCDYFTYTGLPHGCGIEVYKSTALLQANKESQDSFEREHVGPSIYNHKEKYKTIFEPANSKYDYPELRSTIDTYEDYLRACRVVKYIENKYPSAKIPYDAKCIVEALKSVEVQNPYLLVPSVKKGRGTGHFRRCLKIAQISGNYIYVPKDNAMKEIVDLLSNAENVKVIEDLDSATKYSMIVTDYFKIPKKFAKKLAKIAPLVCIDEGSNNTIYSDYLLDIIPSLKIKRNANYTDPSLIELPINRFEGKREQIKKVLISVGGEDPRNLAQAAAFACKKAGLEVFCIDRPISNLKEELYKYDLVITHYGFTAFEAVAAGCAVILLETSKLHKKLAKKYGFAFINKNKLNSKNILKLISTKEKVFLSNDLQKKLQSNKDTKSQNLAEFLNNLSTGKRYSCPLSDNLSLHNKEKKSADKVIYRDQNKTLRLCKDCGCLYIAWSKQPQRKYEKDYFFTEYKNQYGKTYIDDFEAIKNQGLRRINNIKKIISSKDKNNKQSLLDVGCAYGPFLKAAKENCFDCYGIDVSKDAVEYVNNQLNIQAYCGEFPKIILNQCFDKVKFNVITMWYVIEHFAKLDDVLKMINKSLLKNGCFAFSTPALNGISGKFNKKSFFLKSPIDHFTIWHSFKCKKILKNYGFNVKKVVSTGHHPERLPFLSQKAKNNKKLMNLLLFLSKIFRLGDTCEIYCIKIREINE